MAAPAAARKIDRWRSANGQTMLFNPQAAPEDLVDELREVYGYNTKGEASHFMESEIYYEAPIAEANLGDDEAAAGCLADVMISQRKGEFPPVAFMIISKKNRHVAAAELVERLEKAEKVFKNLFAIVIDRYPKLQELQMMHLKRGLCIKIYTASTSSSASKLMMAIHEKHALQLAEKAKTLSEQMQADLLSRDHALSVLQFNMPFLSRDECDMLLDMFGTISALAQATAADILDITVLNADAAQAVEEFFKTEYVVE